MQAFTVKWDFTQKQPRYVGWTGNLPRVFGENNSGVTVEAETEAHARLIVAKRHNLRTEQLAAK